MERRESSQVRGGCGVPVPRVFFQALGLSVVHGAHSAVRKLPPPDKIAANRSHQRVAEKPASFSISLCIYRALQTTRYLSY